ncbi:hypothetical protein GN244_ATG00883 [Phytophthora infestans]|uniref:Uncharacterized protein n=1 Tax=Phytophthora infestans TaxID=4787 RepID=A0A833TNY1_PHYIN|nr:hypothetical protein GN244_ATG00883 [Phytophthora infestans]KAF4130271.1 hypothetical protein GN958_ATG20686 [Phytophthora infestans]
MVKLPARHGDNIASEQFCPDVKFFFKAVSQRRRHCELKLLGRLTAETTVPQSIQARCLQWYLVNTTASSWVLSIVDLL